MSVVSGVTLQIDLAEEEDLNSEEDSIYINILKINEWLDDKSMGKLDNVEQYYGGSKHPQIAVFGGGFNYLPEKFPEFVLSLGWIYPESLVLLIHPEEGTTKVFRPEGY